MLIGNDARADPRLQRLLDKVHAERMVKAMVDGAGLHVKPQARELVVSNPAEPENGQLRMVYATGQVMLKRTIWVPLGLLTGYEYEDGRAGCIGTDQILGALCNDKKAEWLTQCELWLAEHLHFV